MINNAFSISAFFINIPILFVYFSKRRINTLENKLYSFIVITNLIESILALISYFTIINREKIPIINDIFSKLLIFVMFIWIVLVSIYIFIIVVFKQEVNDKIKKIVYGFIYLSCFIVGILVFVNPLYYYSAPLVAYSYGPSANVVYSSVALYTFFCIICVLLNFKSVLSKKIMPFFVFILLAAVSVYFQKHNPQVLLMTAVISYTTFIMYHTIENPDVKMIEQLELARESADKANAAKTDFLSSMSHEIRTPLNAIVGFSDCIKHADNLDEAKENADDIIDASNTLLEIVNGILDISKIEAGKLEIVNSDYNARDLFSGLAKLVTPKMVEKGLDFQVTIAEDLPPTLYGDPANIKKVVTNLLSNAYKYTDKGYVKYDVKCVNNEGVCRLIISVEDSGRGIKKENVEKLFTKFQRVDEDKNTTIEGTGLGLAITKQLIELMGGSVVVTTEYGEGSKFLITLDQRIDNVVISSEVKEVSGNFDLTDKKLLIVDDNPLNLKVATKLFERYNAIIETCDSGFACISKITKGDCYDVILMDDMMPKMSGTETLHKLKESSSFNIPVVALTANAITGMREKYLSEGFNDYLAKPIDKDEMISVLSGIFDDSNNVQVSPVSLVEEINNNTDFLEANGIDIKAGLNLLGDISMYNETMSMFVEETEKRIPLLHKHKENNDMENYAILVHAIKSDCKYLGIMSLADLSHQHELKSKDKDIEFVKNNFDNYINLLEDYVTICKSYLDRD